MNNYWTKNWYQKLDTFRRARQQIINWPTAVSMRVQPGWQGLRLLQFRNGLRIICRSGTKDWDIVNELMLHNGYACALHYLDKQAGRPVVLDLGGNIGVFSLIAAQRHGGAVIYAYEPAPANCRMFEVNCLANHAVADRIELRREAVGGTTRVTSFLYDENDPSASRFETNNQHSFPVQVRSFEEVLTSLNQRVALVKMDIESAEYELIEKTPRDAWNTVEALSVELHDETPGRPKVEGFIDRMKDIGFKHITKELMGNSSYFMSRKIPTAS